MIIDDVWQDHPLPMIHSWVELDEYMKDMTVRYYYLFSSLSMLFNN